MIHAEFVEYEVDVHMKCPSCGKFFRLRNHSIPQNSHGYHNCVECSQPLSISPFTIDAFQRKEQESSEESVPPYKHHSAPGHPVPRSDLRDTAVEAVVSFGFKRKEARSAVDKVYYYGVGLQDLIKSAVSEFQD